MFSVDWLTASARRVSYSLLGKLADNILFERLR